MTDHHMIRTIDRDSTCLYCHRALTMGWVSSFSGRNHYKVNKCGCGKENCVRVNYIGTGHDSWSQLESTVLHSKIIEVHRDIRIEKSHGPAVVESHGDHGGHH